MSPVNSFLAGQMTRYRVVGSVVVCDLVDGSSVYVYQGAWLPAEASLAHVEHLLSEGLIEEVGA